MIVEAIGHVGYLSHLLLTLFLKKKKYAKFH